MYLPPHVVRPSFGLWYWVLLSSGDTKCVHQSPFGFDTEDEARADFTWHFGKS
ncbi:hypothetical protein [Erythrobacter sp. F6033]|uniref:hypothetical protein n=1 Tax=Erythrobacter sp. F6033 TaxID=2926401 RepID=UPI001FF4CFBB|nr:hypothetical protein [Erythrobacter sp. F6033]MCK0128953.1 hypothetical protein [Erythrobacter sp. F6033]